MHQIIPGNERRRTGAASSIERPSCSIAVEPQRGFNHQLPHTAVRRAEAVGGPELIAAGIAGLSVGDGERGALRAADPATVSEDMAVERPGIREGRGAAQSHSESRGGADIHVVGGGQVRENNGARDHGDGRHCAGDRAVNVGDNDLVVAAISQRGWGNGQRGHIHARDVPGIVQPRCALIPLVSQGRGSAGRNTDRAGRVDGEHRGGRLGYDVRRHVGGVIERLDLRRAEARGKNSHLRHVATEDSSCVIGHRADVKGLIDDSPHARVGFRFVQQAVNI